MTHDMTGLMHESVKVSLRILLLATIVHTAAMLLVAGLLAMTFFELYDRAGLRILRRAWVNFDLLWAVALLVAAAGVLYI